MLAIHADRSLRVVVRPGEAAFVPSPYAGVERMMLEREGGEVARATTIVRYAPGARVPAHGHPGGEEIVVLDGIFSDASGHHPAGCYLRNPPASSHAPYSADGCTLFVKLHQSAPDDRAVVTVDTRAAPWSPGLVAGLEVLPLHAHGPEHTALVRWAPGTVFTPHTHIGGEEIYVLDGTFQDEHGSYPAGTWLRNPAMSRHRPFTETGCTIYVKVGHLG